MTLRLFPTKSAISLMVPTALVLLLLAAPVKGQEPEESADASEAAIHKGTEDTHKGSETTSGAAHTSQNELQVTAEKIDRPLPVPDMDMRLARIYLADMRPWNWNGMWHASEWANGDSTIPWKYGRVRQGFGGDTQFILDADGGAELKAQKGHPEWRTGMYEVDVTIPEMRPGLIASPIWLFNDRTKESIAVQVVGKRKLQFTIHGSPTGVDRSEEFNMPGDFSGRRMRIAIRRHSELGLIDFFVDGELVKSYSETDADLPVSAMRPIISLYAANKHGWARNWAGTWEPLGTGDRIRMTVHGYRASPL